MAKTLSYSMPRGDSRTLTIKIPTATYSVGSEIFFALKTIIDNVSDDSSAVVKKTLTDSNIISNDGTNVTYQLVLTPSDTTVITPATYFGEFEFVSADKTIVISYPDPNVAVLKWTITGDVNRRIV